MVKAIDGLFSKVYTWQRVLFRPSEMKITSSECKTAIRYSELSNLDLLLIIRLIYSKYWNVRTYNLFVTYFE